MHKNTYGDFGMAIMSEVRMYIGDLQDVGGGADWSVESMN